MRVYLSLGVESFLGGVPSHKHGYCPCGLGLQILTEH